MRALLKSSKKIVITHVDQSERALINDFVNRSKDLSTTLKSLFDIDNELDGISLELTKKKTRLIKYETPCIQVVTAGGTTKVDLKVDQYTSIDIVSDDVLNYLDVSIEDKIISIKALNIEELKSTTQQYVINVILNKQDYDTTIVPINVTVLYLDGTGTMSYENLTELPKINDVTLIGSKYLDELGIQEQMDRISDWDIDDLFE